MEPFEKLYSVDDVARMTLLTTRTIRNYLRSGLLQGNKIGGQWRFSIEDINRLMTRKQQPNPDEILNIQPDSPQGAQKTAPVDSRNNLQSQSRKDPQSAVRKDSQADSKSPMEPDSHWSVPQAMTALLEEAVPLAGNGHNQDKMRVCSVADFTVTASQAETILADLGKPLAVWLKSGQNTFEARYVQDKGLFRSVFLGTPDYVRSSLAILAQVCQQTWAEQRQFDGKATQYALYRPDYPEGLIEFVIRKAGLEPGQSVVADVGAGTGKFAKALLDRRIKVIAIEPNDDMRTCADALFSGNPDWLSIRGTAERSTLADGQVDAIVCADAFHWVEPIAGKAEFLRILKTDGSVFLIWNQPTADNPWLPALNDLNQRLCSSSRNERLWIGKKQQAANLFGSDGYKKKTFTKIFDQTYESFEGGMLSASFTPRPGDAHYEEYLNGLQTLFDQHSQNGFLHTIFESRCYYGRLRGPSR